MANNIVQLKRSSVLGKVPDSANLQVGEPVVNLADKILYTKDGSNNVIVIGSGTTSNIAEGNNLYFSNARVASAVASQTLTNASFTSNVSANTFFISSSNDYISATTSVESWVYSNVLSVSSQETEPRDIDFSSDGTKMFILGNAGNDVTEYLLGTAWQITTATSGNVFSVATQETTPQGIYFKPDGLRFYVVGAGDTVYRYDMTDAWNISTASYVNSFSVTSQETNPQAVSFSSDGSKMFVMGDVGDDINQYSLSTPWDITSASFSSLFSVSSYETAPQGIYFSSDGTKVWIIGSTYNRITQFSLGTAWLITSAVFDGYVNVGLAGRFNILGASGIYVNESQNRAWITDYQNDIVVEFSTNIPATKLYGSKWLIKPDAHLLSNLIVDANARINGTFYTLGSATLGSVSSPTFNPQSATATFTLGSSTTTGAFNIGTGLTSGILTIGGTSGTGDLIFGRSTSSHNIYIGNSSSTSGTTKAIFIGSGGLSGSNTNVIIGSSVTGARGNLIVHSNTQINASLNVTANIVAGNVSISNSLIIGNIQSNGYKFPASDGTAEQILQTDGEGNLTFVALTSAAGGYNVSTITTFPGHSGNVDYGADEAYVGETAGQQSDAFGVSLGVVYDCMEPIGRMVDEELGVLT